MTQREALREALRLAEEHPEADIHICVASDDVLDDFVWTSHKIDRVQLGWWYMSGERIVIDLDEIREEMESEYDRDVSIEEAEKAAKRVVLIYTDAG